MVERSHPFFKFLKKQMNFEWMKEHKEAFRDLKKFLSALPILCNPKSGEPLYVYLLVIEKAIRSVLMRGEQK